MKHEMLSPDTADRQFLPFSFLPPNRHLTQPQFYKNSADYSLYSPKAPITPSSSISLDEFEDPAITENRLYLAGLRRQYQDFANRYELCLSHLQDASHEAEALQLENERLRISNGVLRERLVMGRDPVSIADEFRKLRIESSLSSATTVVESPTSVLEPRVALPKSISVRSTGYKKLNADGKARISKPVMVASQRVYVGGGSEAKKGSHEPGAAATTTAALELEVYNQGMFKTELCNKWQESGQCPYGDHCQFAHGIGELRPVIRHPRYKTEVCRMVLAGDACPYGHRCHFRHALSRSDRPPL